MTSCRVPIRQFPDPIADTPLASEPQQKTAVLAGGCFWCVEAIEVRYDASQTTLGQLLKIHFSVAHDPTQLNRQGNDVGRQYRSAIFYADDEQKRVAEAYIRQLNEARVFTDPIVTTLEPLEAFYPAEEYHQDYAARNPY